MKHFLLLFKNLKVVTSLLIAILVFVEFYHPIYAIQQDLGLHLLLGKIIVQTKHVPLTNYFSAAFPNFPFINTHWLSEVIFYEIYHLTNFNVLLIITTIFAILSFLVIFIFAVNRYNPIICFFVALIYLQILLERTDLRPEIISFFFLSLIVFLLFANREKFTRWIYLIIPIEALWVNIHIYFPIGILLLALFIIDEVLTKKQLVNKKIKHLLLVGFLSSLAILLNPNNVNGALYPLMVFRNYGYSVEENQSIFFLTSLNLKPTYFFFLAAVALFASLFIVNFKKMRYIDLLLVVVFSCLGISAVRNFPLFVFTTFIPFCYMLNLKTKNLTSRLTNLTIKTKIFVITVFLLLFLLSINYFNQQNLFGYSLVDVGAKGADFYLKNNIKGPLFNDFDNGSYLDYRLYPKTRVLVDARPEAYPASFFQNFYLPVQNNINYFEQASNYYHYNSIIFLHTQNSPWARSFLYQIVREPNWSIVYLDDYTIILVRNNKQNAALISKYQISESTFKIPNKLTQAQIIRYFNFFTVIDWPRQKEKVLLKALQFEPKNCSVYKNLIIVANRLSDPNVGTYLREYQKNCQ